MMKRFMAMGAEVAASGKPPTPEVAQQMKAIQVRTRSFSVITLVLLVTAVLAMAGARYSG